LVRTTRKTDAGSSNEATSDASSSPAVVTPAWPPVGRIEISPTTHHRRLHRRLLLSRHSSGRAGRRAASSMAATTRRIPNRSPCALRRSGCSSLRRCGDEPPRRRDSLHPSRHCSGRCRAQALDEHVLTLIVEAQVPVVGHAGVARALAPLPPSAGEGAKGDGGNKPIWSRSTSIQLRIQQAKQGGSDPGCASLAFCKAGSLLTVRGYSSAAIAPSNGPILGLEAPYLHLWCVPLAGSNDRTTSNEIGPGVVDL